MKLSQKILLIFCTLIYLACKKSTTSEPEKPVVSNPVPPTTTTPVSSKLSITSFTPKSASSADTITINGTGFGTKQEDLWVDFGGSLIHPLIVSPTQIKAIIIDQSKSGKIRISLKDSVEAFSEDIFTKVAPVPVNITSTLPGDNGRIGETLIINGSGFGTDPDKLIVKFGTSATAKPFSANNTTLSVTVPKLPDNILATDLTVQNGTESFKIQWSITFLKPNPIIHDFSPKIVNEGDTLTITGEYLKEDYNQIMKANFGDSDESNLFTLDAPFYDSEKELRFKVRLKNKEVRKAPIKLLIYDGSSGGLLSYSAPSKDNLTTRPATIVNRVSSSANEHDFTNANAKVGEYVAITGTFAFSDYPGISVQFTGSTEIVKPDIALSIYPNRVKVRVPIGAKSGVIKVWKQDWGAGITENSLTILP